MEIYAGIVDADNMLAVVDLEAITGRTTTRTTTTQPQSNESRDSGEERVQEAS
jgi:hypothetical protein